MEEKQEFFINAGKVEDEEDLLDELNELEAEMAAAELEEVEIGSGLIHGGKQAEPAKPQAAKSEEDELKALEMMMA
jgi:cell division septum initiation protein DivIVA